jgi:diacylglycerol kinase family enzyme
VTQSPRHLLVFLNPAAGRGQAQTALGLAAGVLRVENVTLDVRHTASADHARELAQTLPLEGVGGIGIVGGDGTVNGVIDGLMHRRPEGGRRTLPPLAIIPSGSGNALAHDLSCLDPIASARRILAGETVPLDVMRLTTPDRVLHAVNIVGWGLAADVGARAERMRRLGSARYRVATLLEVLRCKPQAARIEVAMQGGGGELMQGRFTMILAANTRHTGAGLVIAPQARLDDGQVDLIEVLAIKRRHGLQLFNRVRHGTHLDSPLLRFRQVKGFTIGLSRDADKGKPTGDAAGTVAGDLPLVLNVDGEIMKFAHDTLVVVKVMRRALSVYAAAKDSPPAQAAQDAQTPAKRDLQGARTGS